MAALPQWSEATWLQFNTCGVLIYFESLLSCYGDEKGMLEDMTVAVKRLGSFELHFFPSGIVAGPPHMTSLLTVRVPCPPAVWDRIPEELRLRDRVVMRWNPVHFNVGINEQQTISDRCELFAFMRAVNWRLSDAFVHSLSCGEATFDDGIVAMNR